MKADSSDTINNVDCETLSPSVIFPLLADDRRRYIMHYLAQRVGAVAIGDIAEQIALWEGDLARDRFERIVTGLYHVHLPLLRESGVITYDLERETVERLPPADQLTPYLDLAVASAAE